VLAEILIPDRWWPTRIYIISTVPH
jgi:hypothetical protein